MKFLLQLLELLFFYKVSKVQDPYFSAEEGEDERDYLAGGYIDDIPKAKHTYEDFEIQYHQPDVHNYSCTIHAACGAVSDQTGHRFTHEEYIELIMKARLDGFDDTYGWYVHKAVDLVTKYSKDKGIIGQDSYYVRSELGDGTYWAMMEKGYTAITGFKGNRAYNEDIADGLLNDPKIGQSTYGHAISQYVPKKKKFKEWKDGEYVIRKTDYVCHRDSYSKGTRYPNIYKIPFHFLKDRGLFFRNSYFIIVK